MRLANPYVANSEKTLEFMGKILVTGAAGQIGSELVVALREKHGEENVIATDILLKAVEKVLPSGPNEQVDVTEIRKLQEAIGTWGVTTIYHLGGNTLSSRREEPADGLGRQHEGPAEHPRALEGAGGEARLLAQLHRRLRAGHPKGQDAAGRAARPHHDVWDNEGGGRAALQLLLPPLRRGRPLNQVSGDNQQQGASARGDDRLRRRHVLPGDI